MAPGPNDHHVVMVGPDGKQEPTLAPGLGRDEPSDEQRAGFRAAGAARLHAIKAELEAAGAELNEKEKAIVAREEAAIKKEREIEARERAVAEKERGGKKP